MSPLSPSRLMSGRRLAPAVPVGPALDGRPARAVRRLLAGLALALARRLMRGARALRRGLPVQAVRAVPPALEFYAEAGAPEGALYADGRLVGRLPVNRL